MEQYLIKEAPPTLFYIPNFINSDEEEYILDKVNNSPKPKWTYLSHRRLQNWGGNPMPKGMIPEPLPDWLKFYVDRINNLDIFPISSKANHVLVNEYLAGQGIMPHEDGPLFYPTIVTLNCGSHTVLNFKKKGDDDTIKVCLEPTSLVIIKNSLYKDYLHSIDEIASDKMDEIVNLEQTSYKKDETLQRKTRISLTIRNVPKTSKFTLKLFK